MNAHLCIPLLLLILNLCAVQKAPFLTKTVLDNKPIEETLVELGYAKLFLIESDQLDSLWDEGRNQARLAAVIGFSETSLHAKFLAAEVLRHFEVSIGSEYDTVLAQAYVYALEHTSYNNENHLHLNGNSWGFLYEYIDSGY